MIVPGFDDLTRAELALPKFLQSPEDWQSMDVDYHPPRVERLWRPFEKDMRLFLHCLHPCKTEEALLHPHPWPSVMRVHAIDSAYRVLVGSNAGVDNPQVVFDSIVRVGNSGNYRYAMPHPDGWHAVIPINGLVYSVMLTGKPWNRPIPQVTKDARIFLPLPTGRAQELLTIFQGLYP